MTEEDAIYACCNTFGKRQDACCPCPELTASGTQAAKIIARIDKIMNRLIETNVTLIKKIMNGIKYEHVLKRDRQRMLAYMYRHRKSTSKGKRRRYEDWARKCDTRREAEQNILTRLAQLSIELTREKQAKVRI